MLDSMKTPVSDVAFTPAVKRVQERLGSRRGYDHMAQSSDWAFIMSTGTTVPYATRRFKEHIARFNRLHEQLLAGTPDEELIADLEARDTIFPGIDYRIYAN